MKSILLKIMIVFLTILFTTCRENEPEQISIIELNFETNVGNVSIIETMQNDTSVYLDTIVDKFLPSSVNGYKFQLRLNQETNGDFLIFSHSCKKSLVISKIAVNKNYTFTYLFDGINKNEKDNPVFVTNNMLCN